jgi:hypothetical protein
LVELVLLGGSREKSVGIATLNSKQLKRRLKG